MPKGLEHSSASSLSAPQRQAHLLWSLTTAGAVRGLCLAREKGWLLVRDENDWLYLLDRNGERQGQVRAPKELTTCACADDASAFVTAGREGDLWWLAPDLMPRWQRALGPRVEALAVDPLGQYVAAADTGGGLSLFTRKGRLVWKVQTPRGLRHLAFVAEAPFLIGCSDFGLVACFDAAGRMVWRDGLVAHVGSLAVNGDGSTIALACFSDGLYRYAVKEARPRRQALPDPCSLAVLSYDGRLVLVTGLSTRLVLLDASGRVRGEHSLEAPAVALALSPLADRAVAAMASGRVECLKWR
jgi:hypothetical protein